MQCADKRLRCPSLWGARAPIQEVYHMKVGMELEYWVVDSEGKLAGASELIETHEGLVGELIDSLVEVRIPAVETISELEAVVGEILSEVLQSAQEREEYLVPLGTALMERDPPVITERGKLLQQIYGDDLRYAKNCAGTHVHFDRGNVVRQLNLLTALDPSLSLVSSSTYYGGKRVAASSRSLMYRHQSDAALERYRDLWSYIESIEEWEQRVTRSHELFEEIAGRHGIETETFETYFSPENTVLTPVRLRTDFPTVEWRAPDTALPTQVIQLVRTVKDLVSMTDDRPVVVGTPGVRDDEIGIPSFAELRGLSAAAIVDGIESERVQQYLRSMGFDPSEYDPITNNIAGGYEITTERAREIRLTYAQALKDDVEAIRERTA